MIFFLCPTNKQRAEAKRKETSDTILLFSSHRCRCSVPQIIGFSRSMQTGVASNPLLESWEHEPFHLPPFARIQPGHYKPAFEEAMRIHLGELKLIADNTEKATFENTLGMFDYSGTLLTNISHVFSNMTSSMNTPELQLVQTGK